MPRYHSPQLASFPLTQPYSMQSWNLPAIFSLLPTRGQYALRCGREVVVGLNKQGFEVHGVLAWWRLLISRAASPEEHRCVRPSVSQKVIAKSEVELPYFLME